jgi:hypothetical protein
MGLTMHVSSGLFSPAGQARRGKSRRKEQGRRDTEDYSRYGKRQCWLDRAGATKKAGQSSQDRLKRKGMQVRADPEGHVEKERREKTGGTV